MADRRVWQLARACKAHESEVTIVSFVICTRCWALGADVGDIGCTWRKTSKNSGHFPNPFARSDIFAISALPAQPSRVARQAAPSTNSYLGSATRVAVSFSLKYYDQG